jgi:hypothetical protein
METALTEIMFFSGSAGITRKAGSSYTFRLARLHEGFSEYDSPRPTEKEQAQQMRGFISLQ